MHPQTILPLRHERDLERHTTGRADGQSDGGPGTLDPDAPISRHGAPFRPSRPPTMPRHCRPHRCWWGAICRPSARRVVRRPCSCMPRVSPRTHRDAGHASPCAHPGVRNIIAGHARRQGVAPRQAQPIDRTAAQAIAATAARPRAGRGGTETRPQAARRAALDVALVYVMRDGLLRRSEAAALRWADLENAEDGSGRLLIRRSKTRPGRPRGRRLSVPRHDARARPPGRCVGASGRAPCSPSPLPRSAAGLRPRPGPRDSARGTPGTPRGSGWPST